jgi:signal peptidase I
MNVCLKRWRCLVAKCKRLQLLAALTERPHRYAPRMDGQAQLRATCCELAFDVARSSGEARLRVSGVSMLPAVWPGDVVTVQHKNPGELLPGQIVVYRRDELLIVHRITKNSGDHLITRGDARPFNDPPVRAIEILGHVISIHRDGRHINPEQSAWQRAASSILCHSDFSTRLTLAFSRRLRRLREMQMRWASS